MTIKKMIFGSGILLLALSLGACGKKMKTVTTDMWLMETPVKEKPTWVQNGKVKRGEYVKMEEERIVDGVKFFHVQVEGVTTKGWISEQFVKDGKLQSVTVIIDSDLYMRPNEKSDKTGRVAAGQVAFKIEEKDKYVLINYPGTEAYVLKTNLGSGTQVVKTITLPGLGTATVSASSQYLSGEGKELEFDPRNLFDGNLQTAWCEGKTGDDGIGEYVQLNFPYYVDITEIAVVNGWTKSETLYKQNGRIQELKVAAFGAMGEATQLLNLMDENYDYQPTGVMLNGTGFKFSISKVYKGTDPDTCMGEIRLTGTQRPQMMGMP